MIDDPRRELVRNFINDNCIERRSPGSPQYLLHVNKQQFYGWQFYTRAALLDPICLDLITDHFFSLFRPILGTFQLAGVESASTPLMTALVLKAHQMRIDLNAFSIRKEQKPYGKRNWIEGRVVTKPVLIVDDLTSENHKTMFHADKILNLHQIHVINHVYCLIRKQKQETSPVIKLLSGEVTIHSMFTLDDFDLLFKNYWDKKESKRAQ